MKNFFSGEKISKPKKKSYLVGVTSAPKLDKSDSFPEKNLWDSFFGKEAKSEQKDKYDFFGWNGRPE